MSGAKILPLKQDVVYGPVNSRRLGKSLGINVLAAKSKICTLNCLYCQYGYTRIADTEIHHPTNFYPAQFIIHALESRLKSGELRPDYLTFSGNGEATLHPDFFELVGAVIALRDKYIPAARTAILSNGTQIGQKLIQVALDKLDLRIIKLDCAETGLYKCYNRPLTPFDLTQLIAILSTMKNIIIQALFTGGRSGNFFPEHNKMWIETVKSIRPLMVQIYSLDRGYPSRQIVKLTKNLLQSLMDELMNACIPAQVY
jgi:wyosine [tRNA(Phe)-imidazoG37] synthetase (radical SAM superfamily)